MDEFVYNAYAHYFSAIRMTGSYPYGDVGKLLVLDFIFRLVYQDYRGYIKEKDYGVFERGLECLYGTSCLTPYPDYLKMGRMRLGDMTELLYRIGRLNSAATEADDRITAVEESVKGVEGDVSDLREDAEDMAKTVDTVKEDVKAAQTDITSLNKGLSDTRSSLSALVDTVATVEERVSVVEEGLSTVGSDHVVAIVSDTAPSTDE